jgi:hypothetical protein
MMKKTDEEKNDSGGQDLTLALLVANAAAAFAFFVIYRIASKRYFPTLEAIRKVYSGLQEPEDYREGD